MYQFSCCGPAWLGQRFYYHHFWWFYGRIIWSKRTFSLCEYQIRYLQYNNIFGALEIRYRNVFRCSLAFLTFVNKQFRIMSLLKYRMQHCLIILKRAIEGTQYVVYNVDSTDMTTKYMYNICVALIIEGPSMMVCQRLASCNLPYRNK